MAASASVSLLARWWHSLDRPGWRNFAVALLSLGAALLLALYSGVAAETGNLWLAACAALGALGVAGWVALTIVPALARRTPLRWLAYQIDYKLTREGVVYLTLVFIVTLAALNTGNNLLFLVLASLLAGIIVSGVLSRMVLTGVELKLELQEHIFAAQPIVAVAELRNEKLSLPSFSLRLIGEEKKRKAAEKPRQILTTPVYFPYLPRQQAVRQNVELVFPSRGVYRQDAFGLRTRFPFGFLQKTRRVESRLEVVVYPRVEPTEEFYEALPLMSGELESFQRGRGHDLYSIRDYQSTDSARHVDWKASAKTGTLQVREFTREDERRVMLVLDTSTGWQGSGLDEAQFEQTFERAVTFCACLAWHFHEIDSALEFRAPDFTVPLSSASDVIYDVLRHLAFAQPCTPPRHSASGDFLAALAQETHIYKIILTSRPRGSIPTSLWTSSFFLFIQSL